MVTIIAPILLIVVITGALAAFSAYHEANEIYDTQLSHLAKILLAIESKEPVSEMRSSMSPSVELIAQDQKYEKNIAFRVWVGEKLQHRSESATDFGPKFNIDGFSNRIIADDFWRIFVLTNTKQNITVEVAERLSIRAEMIWFIVGAISVPLLVMLPLLVFFSWRGTARGLSPLQCLSREITQRSPHDLTPIVTGNQPAEITPLLNSINNLMRQLNTALEAERRFTDYAAHELRTPLAAIKTLFQTACKSENPEERKYLAEKLGQAIDRATHLVTQLLTLARVSHADLEIGRVDVAQVVTECVEELRPKWSEKRQQLALPVQTSAFTNSYAPLLHTLVQNILLNAVHYTPEGGQITLTLKEEGNDVCLTITDTGPGIPLADRSRVFENFYRGDSPSPSGAGLGLSIVRTIAEKLGIKIFLETPEKNTGLSVKINMPR